MTATLVGILAWMSGCADAGKLSDDSGVMTEEVTDRDGDGWPDALDCDPDDSEIRPDAVEICDRIDNDCDGSVDEGEHGSDRLCGLWGEIPSTEADATFTSPPNWASGVGLGVGAAGDVDGDGRDDLLIGAERMDVEDEECGAAYLFLRSSSGVHDLSEADASFLGDWAGARVGFLASGLGDLDGDGLADLGLLAYGVAETAMSRSVLHIVEAPWSGSGSLTERSLALPLPEPDPEAIFQSLSWAPTLDAGGSTVLVGLPYESGYDDPGRILAVAGQTVQAAPLAELATAELLGQAEEGAGYAVDGTGDADGDGVSDVLVGTIQDAGAYLALGPLTGSVSLSDADTQILGNADVLPHVAVAFAGDLDGDGTDDLLLGAPTAGSGEGAVVVCSGTLRGLATVDDADALIDGETPYGLFGLSLDGLGDQDGDGYAEIGASGDTDDLVTGIFVFYGPLSGIIGDGDREALLGGDQPALGRVVHAGDVNGDRWPDLLSGPIWGLEDDEAGGGAWLFLGGAR